MSDAREELDSFGVLEGVHKVYRLAAATDMRDEHRREPRGILLADVSLGLIPKLTEFPVSPFPASLAAALSLLAMIDLS